MSKITSAAKSATPPARATKRRIKETRPQQWLSFGTGWIGAQKGLPSSILLFGSAELILLTDGKPNDVDHYEGRYGVEDTRRAVQEARRSGAAVFGVTVDRDAQDYFPALFGRGGYAIVDHIARLPAALPALYRHLVA